MNDEAEPRTFDLGRAITEVAAVAIVTALVVILPYALIIGDRLGDQLLGHSLDSDRLGLVARGAPKLHGEPDRREVSQPEREMAAADAAADAALERLDAALRKGF